MKLINIRSIRDYELQCVIEIMSSFLNKDLTEIKVLEIGSGTGAQAKLLKDLGFKITAIDISDSNYSNNRVFDIVNYNGKDIPFPDECFDVVFSSNALEHIVDIEKFQFEMQRVLNKNGYAIHVLPSGSWRFWTNLSYYLAIVKRAAISIFSKKKQSPGLSSSSDYKKRSKRRIFQRLLPARHGEKGNVFSEIYHFSKWSWIREFSNCNWKIVKISKNHLFYTGHALLGGMVTIKTREVLSKFFGSSCNIFILKK